MKTRDQLRIEDGNRCADKYLKILDDASITEDAKQEVRKFQLGVLILSMALIKDTKSVATAQVAGRIMAEFGNDMATLDARLDEAIIAEGVKHFGG